MDRFVQDEFILPPEKNEEGKEEESDTREYTPEELENGFFPNPEEKPGNNFNFFEARERALEKEREQGIITQPKASDDEDEKETPWSSAAAAHDKY